MIRKLSINSVWLFLTRILTQGLNLVFTVIVARRLGAAGFGQFTVFATIAFLGNVFTTYGLDVLLMRETARERRVLPLTSTAIWLQLFLSMIWCLLFLIGSPWFLSFNSTLTLSAFNASLFPLAFYTVFSSILRAFERMDLFMRLNLFTALLQVVGAIVLLRDADDLLMLSIWLVITQSLSATAGALLCLRSISGFSLQMKPVRNDIAALLRSGWRTALLAPLSLLSQRLNVLMLILFNGEVTTGLLAGSTRILEGLKLGHFAVTNSLMSSMARPAGPQQKIVYGYAFSGLLLTSFILALGVMLFAESITSIIFGPGFEPTSSVLRIVVWTLIPYTFSVYYSLKLLMRGAESIVLKASLVSLLLAIFFYLLLIPMFGLRGAAWGTLLIENFQAAALLIAHYRKSDTKSYASQPT